MIQTLPLPYELDALRPHLSARSVQRHREHHAGCVAKLNASLQDTPHAQKSLEDLILERVLFNDACHAWNHDFYWRGMKPGGEAPGPELSELIRLSFGDFARFRARVSSCAKRSFGAGWVWVVRRVDGNLDVMHTDAASLVGAEGFTPVLVCDLWEHAYYLDYGDAREDYVDAWWDLVDWGFVERNLVDAFGAVMPI